MEIFKILDNGSKQLKRKNILSHQLDTEILLSEALNISREKLLVNSNTKVSSKTIDYFNKLLNRRLNKEPVATILNRKEFWSKNFSVNKNTLIPRPETELMVEKIVKIFHKKNISILDIGTGSGCILLSLLDEMNKSKGIGLDISQKAILIAKFNAKRHKLIDRAKFFRRDISNFYNNKFDLIVSNPPYIMKRDLKNLDECIKKFEPKIALDGGNDGLDVIKKVIYKSKSILKIKGTLAIEIGNEQFKKVSTILRKNKFNIKYIIKDYKENIRCIMSTLEH